MVQESRVLFKIDGLSLIICIQGLFTSLSIITTSCYSVQLRIQHIRFTTNIRCNLSLHYQIEYEDQTKLIV